MRRGIFVLGAVGVFSVLALPVASAHSALRISDPLAGSVLDQSPSRVRLYLTETPEPSLSTIRVVDSSGAEHQVGTPQHVTGDPRSLEIPVEPLGRGVYTVVWRVLSGVDGHPKAGTFAFGIRVLPPLASSESAGSGDPSFSWLELAGRWSLILGLVGLLGGATAAAEAFGRPSGGRLLVGAWSVCLIGLLLLSEAQRRNADASYLELWPTSVGHALAWRGAAIISAGVALLVAQFSGNWLRRSAMWFAACGAAAAMAVHVHAGHAGGAGSWRPAVIAAQWAHFTGVGVWIGGLVALLGHIRGATSSAKAAAIQRFSSCAALALGIVVATGVIRALGEISTWDELTSTGYGRGVLAKIALVTCIAVLAAVNRWRNVRRTSSDLRPLRFAAGGEVFLAAGALVAAATLAGLSPPQVARAAERSRITVSGSDPAMTVKVKLTTASALPGANRFTVQARDYDTGRPVSARTVRLRFTPLDDPGEVPTELALRPEGDGAYDALGNNLALQGRWEVAVMIERDNASVLVPLVVETRTVPQFVSVTRIPGQPTTRSVQIADETLVGFTLDPERPGPSKLSVSFGDFIGDERPVDRVVVTTTAGSDPTRQTNVRRAGPGTFVADVRLAKGPMRITAIGRTADGRRLYASVTLSVSGG